MIVRKYTRRSRSTAAGDDDPFSSSQDTPFSSSQDAPFSSQDDPFALPFSSQDSSQWSLDLDPTPSLSLDPSPAPLPPRRGRRGVKRDGGGEERGRAVTASATATATLMEAQEFGEMMEHMDEVNFALDGLRPAQPARIRRASLLSLLGICGTAQQRRLLRAQGMARRIIDAILDLTFDDSPSTVAAAALFFVLASDLQDDHLLDSPSCIHFLLKLLNPPSDPSENKTPGIGSKLLQMRTRHILNGADKRIDSSSKAIISKVHEILLSCNEIRSAGADDEDSERPELSSKWISLLTMEKACLSTVSFEDTADTVRKAEGTFKERLRELGGLDAVFHVIASCLSTMEGWFRKKKSPSVPDLKDGVALKNLVLILKCLKIMENATFLSKNNQVHLLGMKGQLDSSVSFVGVVLSAIKCFSDLSLLQSSTTISSSRKSNCASESVHPHSHTAPEVERKETLRGNKNGTSSCANTGHCGIEMDRHMNNLKISHKRQKLSASQSKVSVSCSETITSCGVHSVVAKNCSASISCNGALSGSNGERCVNANGVKLNKSANGSKLNFAGASNGRVPVKANASKMNSPIGEDVKSECGKDSFDPFAFDENELEPTKWEIAMKKEPSEESQQSHQRDIILREQYGWDRLITGDQDSSQLIDEEFHLPSASSCRSTGEDSNLLDDCLLTAIKVLMNLTNDNPVGCQQIAACGVMDTMASLIINHFPLHVKLEGVTDSKTTVDNGHLDHSHLKDHELDFLVAILGLLVNLVEKDSQNRSRLASAHIPVARPGKSKSKENPRDVITLLCSMFLANQGAGEAAEEGRLIDCDEASLLQGEREAEMMIVEAYVALLLAFLSTESGKVREDIARCLPNHNLEALVPVLERFVAFHLSLNMISPDTHSTVVKVIESCKGC